jgi:hypothetical protein
MPAQQPATTSSNDVAQLTALVTSLAEQVAKLTAAITATQGEVKHQTSKLKDFTTKFGNGLASALSRIALLETSVEQLSEASDTRKPVLKRTLDDAEPSSADRTPQNVKHNHTKRKTGKTSQPSSNLPNSGLVPPLLSANTVAHPSHQNYPVNPMGATMHANPQMLYQQPMMYPPANHAYPAALPTTTTTGNNLNPQATMLSPTPDTM